MLLYKTMSIQETENAMADKLRTIFTNKEVQAKMVEAIVHNKPIGWARKSQATYYREPYALELKKILDDMMLINKEFSFSYKWFEETFGLGKDTLYARVYQSMRYLTEKLDPDGKYKKFLDERIAVRRERGRGVVLRFQQAYQTGGPAFEPAEVISESEEPKWKQRMTAWLESEDDAPFIQPNLLLSPEEITSIEIQLAALGDSVMYSITAHSIKIMKCNTV